MSIRDELRRYFIDRKTEFTFIEERYYEEEMEEWLEFYTPPASVPKDALIVDIGAREADTALFYWLLGYTNLRLVEPWDRYFVSIEQNVKRLRRMGARIDLRLKPFDQSDLAGAAFVKFDCEGCERAIDLTTLKIPAVAELHDKLDPIGGGVFSYCKATGYLRWTPRECLTNYSASPTP